MQDIEKTLQNTIDSQGWAEGAATPERLQKFYSRRVAAIALADIAE
jgi:hypothetical protein